MCFQRVYLNCRIYQSWVICLKKAARLNVKLVFLNQREKKERKLSQRHGHQAAGFFSSDGSVLVHLVVIREILLCNATLGGRVVSSCSFCVRRVDLVRPWRPSSGSFSNLRPRSGNSTLSRRALAVQGPRREVRGQSCSLFRRTGTPLSWWADWRSSSTPSVPSRSRTSWWY